MKCEECGKEFGSQEALDSHRSAKHSVIEKKPKVKLKKSHAIYGLIAVVLVGIVGATYVVMTGPGPHDDFAKCLTDQGAVYYGAFWCPHCAEQNQIFGSSKKYVNYVECSLPDRSDQTPVCKAAGIESYPTWEFADGSRLSGVIPLQQLAAKTGCSL